MCCNLFSFSVFQPSCRAQGFGAKFKRTKLPNALLTDRCANRHGKRLIDLELQQKINI